MRFLESEEERYGLRYGDILVCEGGEPGRCAIWKEHIPNMKFQKALHRVRVHEDPSDLVVLFCLEKQIWDLASVNYLMDSFDLKDLDGYESR